MIPGIYQGASAMSALERWQTAITGNLASGSVAGFKKDETSFSSALAGRAKIAPGDVSAEAAYLPQATSRISDGQGALRQTGKDLDLAVQGAGYFQVRTPQGGTAFTRNGEFHLTGAGKLVNRQGLDVLTDGGPVNVDIKLGALSVDATGQISQGDTILGKLSLFDLGKSGPLQRSGDGLLVPAEGGTPPRVQNPEVLQGYVEESNVVPLQEMVNLISVSRAYEVSQKLITSLDQTTRSAIETLGTP